MRNNIPSQDDIKNSWLDKRITVSFCCLTFNHSQYIEETLRGFLIQKTRYAFEIVIHDDASTDNTLEILREYQKLYPDIIRIITNTTNQYSIFPNKPLLNTLAECKGDYIAICEGDDFWISNDKIEKQTLELANNPYLISFHSAKTIKDGQQLESIFKYKKSSYSFKEALLIDHHFIQTCTLMFKRELINYLDFKILEEAPIFDIFLKIWGINNAGILYVSDIHGAYRVNSLGSWSSSLKLNEVKLIDTFSRINSLLSQISESEQFIEPKFIRAFQKKIRKDITLNIDLTSSKDEEFQKKFKNFSGYSIRTTIDRFCLKLLKIYYRIETKGKHLIKKHSYYR